LNPIGATVCVDKVKKKPLNYGFVSFSSLEAAQKACDKMNNFELKGKYLRVSVQKTAGEKFDTEANLFIRNLAVEVTQKEFFDFFS
jgi:splicing factor 3B subunit 4